jgi:hypothetical protein
MKTKLKYWIKERYNPQLGTYYVRCGQLSQREANAKEKSIYGENTMKSYITEKEYEAALLALRNSGEKVN